MAEPLEPVYSFSIPSVQDDTTLDCRVYHPKDLHKISSEPEEASRCVKGAVIAHPYAPLGGCFDDSVVLSVTESLLDKGFVVGTFNFRGAGDSHGSTTWTGKAEQSDYVSFAGFLVYYLKGLKPVDDTNTLEPIQSASNYLETTVKHPSHENFPENPTIKLVLGGYSYGSLILVRLPPILDIIQRFESAEPGTTASEILLRARTLASQTKRALEALQSPSSPRGRQLSPNDVATSPTKRIAASPITVGGEEIDPSARRRSRDSRRSMGLVRKSVEMPHRIKAHVRRQSTPREANRDNKRNETSASSARANNHNNPAIEVCYLLISPVLLPFTHALAPPGAPPTVFGLRKRPSTDASPGTLFLHNPTLAVFGSSDAFTSSRRLKAWAATQSSKSKSSFEWHEIDGAGHFWREAGVMQALQRRIAAWVK